MSDTLSDGLAEIARTELRRPATRRTYLLAGAGIVAMIAAVCVAFALTRTDTVSPQIMRETYTTSPAVVTVQVDKAADRAYTCTVEVQDDVHDALGDVTFDAPAGVGRVTKTVRVPYRGKAFAVEVTQCLHH